MSSQHSVASIDRDSSRRSTTDSSISDDPRAREETETAHHHDEDTMSLDTSVDTAGTFLTARSRLSDTESYDGWDDSEQPRQGQPLPAEQQAIAFYESTPALLTNEQTTGLQTRAEHSPFRQAEAPIRGRRPKDSPRPAFMKPLDCSNDWLFQDINGDDAAHYPAQFDCQGRQVAPSNDSLRTSPPRNVLSEVRGNQSLPRENEHAGSNRVRQGKEIHRVPDGNVDGLDEEEDDDLPPLLLESPTGSEFVKRTHESPFPLQQDSFDVWDIDLVGGSEADTAGSGPEQPGRVVEQDDKLLSPLAVQDNVSPPRSEKGALAESEQVATESDSAPEYDDERGDENVDADPSSSRKVKKKARDSIATLPSPSMSSPVLKELTTRRVTLRRARLHDTKVQLEGFSALLHQQNMEYRKEVEVMKDCYGLDSESDRDDDAESRNSLSPPPVRCNKARTTDKDVGKSQALDFESIEPSTRSAAAANGGQPLPRKGMFVNVYRDSRCKELVMRGQVASVHAALGMYRVSGLHGTHEGGSLYSIDKVFYVETDPPEIKLNTVPSKPSVSSENEASSIVVMDCSKMTPTPSPSATVPKPARSSFASLQGACLCDDNAPATVPKSSRSQQSQSDPHMNDHDDAKSVEPAGSVKDSRVLLPLMKPARRNASKGKVAKPVAHRASSHHRSQQTKSDSENVDPTLPVAPLESDTAPEKNLTRTRSQRASHSVPGHPSQQASRSKSAAIPKAIGRSKMAKPAEKLASPVDSRALLPPTKPTGRDTTKGKAARIVTRPRRVPHKMPPSTSAAAADEDDLETSDRQQGRAATKAVTSVDNLPRDESDAWKHLCVGMEIEVWWTDMERYYPGKVVKQGKGSDKSVFTIDYPDEDDYVTHDLAEETFRILEDVLETDEESDLSASANSNVDESATLTDYTEEDEEDSSSNISDWEDFSAKPVNDTTVVTSSNGEVDNSDARESGIAQIENGMRVTCRPKDGGRNVSGYAWKTENGFKITKTVDAAIRASSKEYSLHAYHVMPYGIKPANKGSNGNDSIKPVGDTTVVMSSDSDVDNSAAKESGIAQIKDGMRVTCRRKDGTERSISGYVRKTENGFNLTMTVDAVIRARAREYSLDAYHVTPYAMPPPPLYTQLSKEQNRLLFRKGLRSVGMERGSGKMEVFNEIAKEMGGGRIGQNLYSRFRSAQNPGYVGCLPLQEFFKSENVARRNEGGGLQTGTVIDWIKDKGDAYGGLWVVLWNGNEDTSSLTHEELFEALDLYAAS